MAESLGGRENLIPGLTHITAVSMVLMTANLNENEESMKGVTEEVFRRVGKMTLAINKVVKP